MNTNGYNGICPCCFGPVKTEECAQIYPKGSYFHKSCIVKHPNNYYLQFESFQNRFCGATLEDLEHIMEDMKKAFNIPDENNEHFNKENPEVITLYKHVSEARIFINPKPIIV